MQQGNLYRCLDSIGHFVHGVGTQHQCLGTGALQLVRSLRQQLASRRPVACALQMLNLGKVHAVQNNPCRVQATQTLLHTFVNELVIQHSGLPSHAANQADGLH